MNSEQTLTPSSQSTALAAPPTHPWECRARTAQEAADNPIILVMHASVGSGHRSAANAIAEALEQRIKAAQSSEEVRDSAPVTLSPELIAHTTVKVHDILDFGRIVFNGDKAASMFVGWTRPFYDLTWRYTFTGRLLWGGGTIWSRIMYPQFTEYVRRLRPAAIVCTHITAANTAVSARMLTGYTFPVVCVPTDYEAEGLWPHLSTDLFCAANEYMAETLRPRRVNDDNILITGIPVSPAFSQKRDKAEARKEFNLPEHKQVVLALAGARLQAPYLHFRQALDELLPFLHNLPELHLVLVAGADEEYERRLRREVADFGLTNVTVLGYVNSMPDLMEAADVVICKPGGLTVTECLCAHAPMILLGKAYGQEKANVRMLTAAGAAMAVTTPRELFDTLRHLAKNPTSENGMLINASMLRRPHAADDIAAATFNLIAKEPVFDAKLRRRRFVRFYWGKKPAHTR